MAKTTAKKNNKPKVATKAAPQRVRKSAAAVARNTRREVKKVDVVDEVKQELKAAEAQTAVKKSKKSGGMSWGILILALVVIFGGVWLWRQVKVERLKVELPATIEQLGGGMALKELKDWKYRGGVWEFKIVFDLDGEETEFTSYVSEDGKLLFTSGIDLKEFSEGATDEDGVAGEASVDAATCESVAKAEQGQLDAYIVSQCPYGLQMQRAIASAISEAPELAEQVKVRYIGDIVNGKITSMHGEEEAIENMRQICIREEQAEKYWPYVGCYMKAGETDDCLVEAGVNITNMESCAATPSRGNAYAQEDFDLASTHGVSGSPTLVVNNTDSVSENNFGGRSAEAVKQMVCCGSSTQAAFCSQTLSTGQAATSYSEQMTSASTSTAGSC